MGQKEGETKNAPAYRISPEQAASAAREHKQANTTRTGGVTVKTGNAKKIQGQTGPAKE